MKLFLFSILFLLSQKISGADIKQYHQLINKAECAIMQNELAEASLFYEEAFRSNETPFAVDIYNAAICGLQQEKVSIAFDYCLLLAKRGVGKKLFSRSVFAPLHAADSFSRLEVMADSAQKCFSEKNKQLIEQLTTMTKRDQDYHKLLGPASGTDKYDSVYNEVRSIDNITSKELMALFVKHDLSEFNLGAFISNDSTLTNSPDWFIMILHNYQGNRMDADTLFSAVLREYVADGKMKPEVAAGLMDNGSSVKGKKFYGQAAFLFPVFEQQLYRNRYFLGEALPELIENRKELMLYSMEDLQLRVKYNFNEREKLYLIQGSVAFMGGGGPDRDQIYEPVE